MSYALDTKKIKYLIAAFSTDYKNDKDEEIQEAILDQIGDLAKETPKGDSAARKNTYPQSMGHEMPLLPRLEMHYRPRIEVAS